MINIKSETVSSNNLSNLSEKKTKETGHCSKPRLDNRKERGRSFIIRINRIKNAK